MRAQFPLIMPAMELTTLLIVCPLIFLSGLVDSIAGGGGLISLTAYLLAGLPAHLAIGTNKLSAFIGTAVATGRMAKAGFIKLRLAVPAVVGALVGSAIGARLALLMPDGVFQVVMIVALPVTAFFVLRKNTLESDEGEVDAAPSRGSAAEATQGGAVASWGKPCPAASQGQAGSIASSKDVSASFSQAHASSTPSQVGLNPASSQARAGTLSSQKQLAIVAACAFAIGAYDGFYGPGTGTFMLIAFTAAAKLSVREASGQVKAANLASNIAGFVTFALAGEVWWALGLTAAVFAMAGNYIGAGLVLKDGSKIVRPIIIVVLCMLFVKVILTCWGKFPLAPYPLGVYASAVS